MLEHLDHDVLTPEQFELDLLAPLDPRFRAPTAKVAAMELEAFKRAQRVLQPGG